MSEEKRRIALEYPMNSTVSSLYGKLSTDGGLKTWFADDVDCMENVFVFFWNRIPQEAVMLESRDNKFIRFKWVDDEHDDHYFEFRIENSELTGELSLVVVDFAADSEYDDLLNLWDNNIKRLRLSLGVGN